MWTAACPTGAPLAKLLLTLLDDLRLEGERLCVRGWALEALATLDSRQAASLYFRRELLLMGAADAWPPAEVEGLLEGSLAALRAGEPLDFSGKAPSRRAAGQLEAMMRSEQELLSELRAAQKREAELLRRLRPGGGPSPSWAELLPDVEFFDEVPRVSMENLSFEEFFSSFALLRRPVVIEGLEVLATTSESASAWEEVREARAETLLYLLLFLLLLLLQLLLLLLLLLLLFLLLLLLLQPITFVTTTITYSFIAYYPGLIITTITKYYY